MTPGPPAVCEGTVWHRRNQPEPHEFTYAVSQAWLDPDAPHDLCAGHPCWSATRWAPVRFSPADYGDGSSATLGEQVRNDLRAVLGASPTGPVRMLTQLRRWGWLFNPITLYLAWSSPDDDRPAGAVLEVTNTPWKERHRYPVALVPESGRLTARFAKTLHVSPFLDEAFDYVLQLDDRDDDVRFSIDVVDPFGGAVVNTSLQLRRTPATHAALARSLRTHPFPTHRVSAGIHAQALRLWVKRVPFVPHPDKRTSEVSS